MYHVVWLRFDLVIKNVIVQYKLFNLFNQINFPFPSNNFSC